MFESLRPLILTLLASGCCASAASAPPVSSPTAIPSTAPSATRVATTSESATTSASPNNSAPAPIEARAAALGRGINLGNALEAPKEGEWGVTLRDQDFPLVANAGFDHVRIPIRWSAHASERAPFTIDADFFERVDWAVNSSLEAGLGVIINVHHYDGIAKQPDEHQPRLIGMWKQIAEHYAAYPDDLYFELLNEPHDALTADKNNALIKAALPTIRQSNPTRAVIVGSVQWSSFRGLPELQLPDDPNLIVTFHYYDPFDFTHQGAPWVNKQKEVGIEWPGAVGSAENIEADFDAAVAWGKANGRPLYLGEFGAYQSADIASRTRWTTAVVQAANALQLPYAYWELRSGFGAYDLEAGSWRAPLLNALIPERVEPPAAAPDAATPSSAPSVAP